MNYWLYTVLLNRLCYLLPTTLSPTTMLFQTPLQAAQTLSQLYAVVNNSVFKQ